jgi:putative flippase GtrA
MVIIIDKKERNRFLKFALVGSVGAVVDFGVADLLSVVFHVNLIVAGTISFVLAILSNFTWNRFWTYPDSRSKPVVRQLIQFFMINTMGLAIRLPILKFLGDYLLRVFTSYHLKLFTFTPKFLSENLTLAVAVIIVMFWNFFANRYWTYNDIDTPKTSLVTKV